ncbi:microtubule-actin cross-linking factor 1 isoform X4 [Stigmatopora nigra]
MGSSMGCVRSPADGEVVPGGPLPPPPPPLSSKRRRLRFRPRRKGKKNRKANPDDHPPAIETNPPFTGTPDSSSAVGSGLLVPAPEPRNGPSPQKAASTGGGLPGPGVPYARRSPRLSPAWRGIFCLPGEEDAAGAIVDVSSLPGRTAAGPVQGPATPGGGRLCRVQERDHGVVEKTSILVGEGSGRPERTKEQRRRARKAALKEGNGVVRIRDWDARLCVVRTVYPGHVASSPGKPQAEGRVEVLQHNIPTLGNIQKVRLSEEDRGHDVGGTPVPRSVPESGYGSDPSETAAGTADRPTPSAEISEIYVCGESGDLTAKEKLLLWSQQATQGYAAIRCVNFTSSWSDGRVFNALLHRYRPDLIDMEAVSRQSNRENLEQAFEIAESLGVTRLLDAEDVDVPSPDEKSVITYVSSIYDAFPKIPEGGEGVAAHDVDRRWSEYQSRFLSLLQWSRQQTATMADKNFPQNPVELKALYNEYVHLKETEIPAKELEKSQVEHLYKLLEVWMEFGRIQLPQGLHPNHLEEEWGKLILEMLEREKLLRPAVDRLELLLQRANKFQNLALDCEEKLTLAKNTLQSDVSRAESGQAAQCEGELARYLRHCQELVGQMQQELQVLQSHHYYQVERLVFRAKCLEEELVSLRLQSSSLYRKGDFTGGTLAETRSAPTEGPGSPPPGGTGSALPRRPLARAQLVASSSSEDEGGLRFIYELLGWVEETQDLLEGAEWGADLPSVERHLEEHAGVHAAVEEIAGGLREARDYEAKVSAHFRSNYSETLGKLEREYCKLLEHSSWRLSGLESLDSVVRRCTEELIWLNEREEDEIAFDWSHHNADMDAKRESYAELRGELEQKRQVTCSLQETVLRLCQEKHPAKQTLEAYAAALRTQWQWVEQLCLCVERHLQDNTAYFKFTSDLRDSESYLRQLQESIKRQYACDRNSRLSRLEDLLQDSMEEKEQLIEHRGKVASLVGRAKTLVQLRPRSADAPLMAATPIRAVCDYKQIESNIQITIKRGDECALEDNGQRSKWKVISPSGNEATVPSVCFSVPPPNPEAVDAAARTEQLYQQVMSTWHQQHVNMKSLVSWHYLLKDLRAVSEWNPDTVRGRSPAELRRTLDRLDSHLSDFLSDSKESSLFQPAERRQLEAEVRQAGRRSDHLLLRVESEEKDQSASRSYLAELGEVRSRLGRVDETLMGAVRTPVRLTDGADDIALRIVEHQSVQSELDQLASDLDAVSGRCLAFLEDKPESSGVPALRSELDRSAESADGLRRLSSVFLEKLKTVELAARRLEDAESRAGEHESGLAEEDVLPADADAIRGLGERLGARRRLLSQEEEAVLGPLRSELLRAEEAAARLAALRPDAGPEPERYREGARRAEERWEAVKKQTETREAELEGMASVLQRYRDGHSELSQWVRETTRRQEDAPAAGADSKALSEQLAQQTALVAQIEDNQSKLDQCQASSKQYCTRVKDYELQLMTFRAFVESTHKSAVKRRKTHSSSDAVAQEFMDLRTRYTALVTLTTQHVKYISDALRRLEEEEKEVEEEKQARVGQVSDLLSWIGGLRGRDAGPDAESSLAVQQAVSEQLAAKRDQVSEAVASTRAFLLSKQGAKLCPEERADAEARLERLSAAYQDACEASSRQTQQLERRLAEEEDKKTPLCVQPWTCAQTTDLVTQADTPGDPERSVDIFRNFAAGVEKRIRPAMEKAVPHTGKLPWPSNEPPASAKEQPQQTGGEETPQPSAAEKAEKKEGHTLLRRDRTDESERDSSSQKSADKEDAKESRGPLEKPRSKTGEDADGPEKVAPDRADDRGRPGDSTSEHGSDTEGTEPSEHGTEVRSRGSRARGRMSPVTLEERPGPECKRKKRKKKKSKRSTTSSSPVRSNFCPGSSGKEPTPAGLEEEPSEKINTQAFGPICQTHLGSEACVTTPNDEEEEEFLEVLPCSGKTSLARQECLELDQRTVALLSAVRHTEVRLRRHRQQSMGGGGLPALDHVIGETQELEAELRDLEAQIAAEAKAAQQLLRSRSEDLPPQLLLALEKDRQSLATAYRAATALCGDVAKSLRDRRHSHQVVRRQKSECSGKLEDLGAWLAGAGHLLADGDSEPVTPSGDMSALQDRQKKLKEVQKDLRAKADEVAEAVRWAAELLARGGPALSAQEREDLEGALASLKERYAAATEAADASLSRLDTSISATLQHNTQRAKAFEQLQHTQEQMDSLLKDLRAPHQPKARDVTDLSSPDAAVASHVEELQAELRALQAQQARLLEMGQSAGSLLRGSDGALSPEEKSRLRASLDLLQTEHRQKLHGCQERVRKSEALRDELAKFLQEHGNLGAWLENSQRELYGLGEGEVDAQELKNRMEEHRKLAEDIICHKADLRFVSISGQKVADWCLGAPEREGHASLEAAKQLVTDKLRDANHRYTSLHAKSSELGGRLSALLERYQQYQDEVVSLHSWLSAQEQNQSMDHPAEAEPQHLPETLRQIQLLQDELAERSVQLEKVRRAGTALVSTHESPSLEAADILRSADGVEKRFLSLSEWVSQRAERLQTAVARSVSVQEGLKALLAWLDGLDLEPGPVEPTARALQEALTQNQKLRQELLSHQGGVEATRDCVAELLRAGPEASGAGGLGDSLDRLTRRLAAAQVGQAEREARLKTLLPKLENFERLWSDLDLFVRGRGDDLGRAAARPDRGLADYRQTLEEVKSEMQQESPQLKSLCELGEEISASPILSPTQSLLERLKCVSDDFRRLDGHVRQRLDAVLACEQQLVHFRGLSGSLLRWLQSAREQLPAKEVTSDTEALERRVQGLQELLREWESRAGGVQELNKSGAELEARLIDVTAPESKSGAPQINGSPPGTVNGIHTCKDLTEIQVALSDVNGRHEALGADLAERLGRLRTSLDLRREASRDADRLRSWLSQKEAALLAGGSAASPSEPEAARALARENEALLSQLAEQSPEVEALRATLRKLVADEPDSPEAQAWRRELEEIDSLWLSANRSATRRQADLETRAERLGSFETAASQLGPWLGEKELMMSVLGPLSIDANMLATQKQQVQFMLREFETRRPQLEQLGRSAEGILSQTDDPEDAPDVRARLDAVSGRWRDLTAQLERRSENIQRARDTGERFGALLGQLAAGAAALSRRLDASAEPGARPEALRARLRETGEVRSELEGHLGQLERAGRLCRELAHIVAEPYLKDELDKRLESVAAPLRGLEQRAADSLSQLQDALSSTQQLEQTFQDLRSWLDRQTAHGEPPPDALPRRPEALRSLLSALADPRRQVAAQRGSYELILAQGASLLAALPADGDEGAAWRSRLDALRRDWEDINGRLSEREDALRAALGRAESYERLRAELAPLLDECEAREAEIRPPPHPPSLDAALQKTRGLALDLERRRPLLEAFNAAADQLVGRGCHGEEEEEEVRDEKARLNRRADALSQSLLAGTSRLEELSARLKELEEGQQAVDRRLEAARHQIEVQEALGPQACSAKSLERLRSQRENLASLRPRVEYLRDLAQGLARDAPQSPEAGAEGAPEPRERAARTQCEFEEVAGKLEQCCSALESRLRGVSEVQAHVRQVFSELADLDDELDSLGPAGREADALASQSRALGGFLSRLSALRSRLEAHAVRCGDMLRLEGSSPDLLALRRETEALARQAAKLKERGQARLLQTEEASRRVGDFYRLVDELRGPLGAAEAALDAQSAVGSEVDVLKGQLEDFKALERQQVDGVRAKLQQVNAVGQGLIQSAARNTDTRGLEHHLDATNQRWNSLNKRVAERTARLQEALLHCGKFQDALEPLLSWLSDTEELVANQKPPSAEYRVVKAQIQEQKLLQRLLDDRRPTVEMIGAEGRRIAAAADAQDGEKIRTQLRVLAERWKQLLDKAASRQGQLEELQVLALHFHQALEPLGEWLSATERRLSAAEPMGTQTAKISQQIAKHKAVQDDVSARGSEVIRLGSLSQSLAALSCASDRHWLGERVEALRSGHAQLWERCAGRAALLEQALANARLFGEDEVEVLNWLAEVAQRLAPVSVRHYGADALAQDHKHALCLNEEIISRKKTVDQAIKNGQALLKQTTGEEVLLIQEKLDGIKSRYGEMTAASGKALRTLEQALQLATRLASAHRDINGWLDEAEAELNATEPDASSPAYRERQKELKKVSAEKRLVLDTLNEVGGALLDLVPWPAREGLDRLVAEANQRYRQADDTIARRVQLVQAAIQRSQQYEEAVDGELAWLSETERKLTSLGPLSLEPDVTVAQLQVQKAFNIDIIRHKDAVDQLLATRDDILETCGHAQKDALTAKTDSLSARYHAVNRSHGERLAALERAQVLVARFWETHEELEPWLGETENLIGQLAPPAIDADALRLQQDQMRLLRESIAEHKPHVDKLLKIGPSLAELSATEGPPVTRRYGEAERRYLAIKEEVRSRAASLDDAVSQSAQFHDKMDPLLETLEAAVQRLRQPPAVAAEVDKIREQLSDHRAQGLELDKLLPGFSALCARGEELVGRAAPDDPAAQAVRSRLLRLRSLWDEIRQRAEEREGKLNHVLELAGKFWADVAALLATLRDSQDMVKELEDPGVDPSLIKQQMEAAQAIKAETDGLREELEFVRTLGADLIFACGETEKPEVKKTIDEMNGAWESLNRTWRERMERLDQAMSASVQYQDALQSMFDYLDNAVIKLCEMSPVGTDLGTVKHQIEELKRYKVDVYQQQIDMEKLCHQGELMLKKVSDQTDRDMIREPLTELRHLWENLGDKITQRQHKLEGALLALGQFQHALSELQAWLSHTYATLDAQRAVSSDPKAIEIELAKHHVLRNDVLSHHATVEAVNAAAGELLESSAGDEAGQLGEQLEQLNRSWQNLLLKTQDRQKLLEAALQQAEGFHGELEEFLQWMRRTDGQLSAAKPTGGLPETAREQLEQHTELQGQLTQRSEQYRRLLDAGESMLLARGGDEAAAGTAQTRQNLAVLQSKWEGLNGKMDDRRAKLEEAVALASDFQSSLQETINWLTQAEQTLNTAQPPSLLLDTVLFQIDEHKVFVNEVNAHRERVLALEKSGSQLRFASLKQDVVLIKNLLLSVQARWDKLVQRSLDRGRHLDEARKRAKQFHEAWRKLTDWLEEAENRLDSEMEIPNQPDRIKVQLAKHKEFQKALGSKQPVYDTTVRSGRAMRDKAQLPADGQKLDHLVGEVRDKWDTVCGKSVERQHKLEEALLFSGQFAEALQALVDWLYRVEPQLAEDLPVHGDLDLVSNLMDSHKAFQKEMGKRTGSVQALKRSARDLMETGRDDTAWVQVQLQELSNRWETVCALSVTKQTRLQVALKQAEEFRAAIQMLLEWLSEAEQSLRFRGVLPEEAETLQGLLRAHRQFMATVEEKRLEVNRAAGMGQAILALCHPDSVTTVKHWITIIRARFEEVLTWAKQHEQRLEAALSEVLNNANLLEELLTWLQCAEATLAQRDADPLPQDIPQVKGLIAEHQTFMEEMTRKQPDVDKVTKSYKRKPAEPPSSLAERRGGRRQHQHHYPHHPHQQQQQQHLVQVQGSNPRLNQLCARWQQVWLLALERQRKLNDALDRLEELKEFANFDFDVWRKKYMRWMNHKKSRVMDFFRRIDKDQDGKITRQEFIDGILASKFPTSRLEMTAVADIFDRDGDGYIDYYEFVAALHPNKDAYRPTTDADKIEDEVTRQVAQCKCAKRFQVEQIGENKYRFFLGNQFGDSQQLRLVRILRSTVMVRVGGGWMALDEFLVKNDPCRVQHPGLKMFGSDSSSSISSGLVAVTPGYFCCRARGRTNLELREKFILPEGTPPQGVCAFRSRGRRSKPGSRNASPTRSSSSASASHSGASAPATPTSSSRVSAVRPLTSTNANWPFHPFFFSFKCIPNDDIFPQGASSGSKLKRPPFHSSRGSLTGENGGKRTGKWGAGQRRDPPETDTPTHRECCPPAADPKRAGGRAGSRRGSDASDASESRDSRSVCSDASDTPRRPGGGSKPSKIPTMAKKTPSPKTSASGRK